MGLGGWMSLFSKRERERGRKGDGDDASNGRL